MARFAPSTSVLAALLASIVLAGCSGDAPPKRLVGKWDAVGAEKTLHFFVDGRVIATLTLGRANLRSSITGGDTIRTQEIADRLPGLAGLEPGNEEERGLVSVDHEYSNYAVLGAGRLRIGNRSSGRAVILQVLTLTEDVLELKGEDASPGEALWAGKFTRATGRTRW